MKIRLGFVSNSSSSSFIISSPNRPMKISYTVELDLNEIIDKTIKTIKELDEYFEEFSFVKVDQLDPYQKETYLKCKKEIESGRNILIGEASNEDYNEFRALVLNNKLDGKLSNNFNIIKDIEY